MIALFDGSNMLHRCFHVAKNSPLTNSKGEDTACIFKFLRSLKATVTQFSPTTIYAAWDTKVGYGQHADNYRVTLTEGTYKAGRNIESHQDVYANEEKLLPVLSLLGIHNFFPKSLEADDIISWLISKFKGEHLCTIISCDRDFLQLVQPNVQVYNPVKTQLYTISNFEKLIGIRPSEYLRYKAIIGDNADNLRHKSLNGLGPKSALRIIHGEKTLSIEQKQAVKDLMHLMDLKQGLLEHPDDVAFYEEQLNLKVEPDFDAFVRFCEDNGFKSILSSIDSWKGAFSKNRLIDLIASLGKGK